MIRLCSICVILLSACSQPFEFELEDASIVVIDAKVSTAPDASFVRIYTQADSSKLFLPNYQVSVESDNEVISFSYDQNSSSYLPDNNGFTAIPGRRYRLEAISLEGHLLSSEYDAAPELTNFELDIKDTSVFELNNSILVEKRAKTAVAD
ncbi:MAG: DUF4249 family protein, partial [Ekhidna sp.]|nr:DUF4249 family protein [Ekhidna sp.]